MKKITCHEISTTLSLAAMMVILVMTPGVSTGANLKLGDILVAEPGAASVSVVDPVTGIKTIISSGGLLSPANKAVAVALAADGDVIVVHRENGLIRVNPVTGAQSVLVQGEPFRDPWAIAIDKDTGLIYVADSGYDNDRPWINEAGKIIRVDPVSEELVIIAEGSECHFFPFDGSACQNTTSAGSYLSHPYGIAIDYTPGPTLGTLVVTDMSSFNGQGAIVRIQPLDGTQTLLWGPASDDPQVPQLSPLGCPMGVTVEPNGNLLTTTFTFPVPPVPTLSLPTGTYYGCAPPGIFRIDLVNNVQTVLNANAPSWQPNHAYAIGDVIRDEISSTSYVHRVVTAGDSGNLAPDWNETFEGITSDGSVVWENIGRGGDWLIPFGIDAEPMPTPSNPSQYDIIVGDEGYSMLFRLDANGVPTPSDEPLASDISNVSSIDVITFTPEGGFKIEPLLSNVQFNGQSAGMLPAGTTQATLSLTTEEAATCRYSTQAGVAYSAMTNTFATIGSTEHSTTVNGLTNGGIYAFYVRCMDSAGHVNTDDFTIAFSIALPPSVEPVAAYGFGEGSGTVLTDGSGNANTGVVSGATWTTQGKFGKALLFDGVNDWVTVAHAPALNLTTGMTLEAWVYPTANGGGSWRNVLLKERTNNEVYSLYANADTNTPVVYVVPEGQGGGPLNVQGAAQLSLNTWTHLAATYDGATLRLYVNGTEVGNRVMTGALLTSTGALRIGGNSLWGEFFKGRIDEVRIYNRPLTRAEILTDMAASIDGSLPNTTPPGRFDGQPVGVLGSGTTQTTVSLTTDENATCKYSTTAGVAYSAMPTTFTTTGATTHTTTVNGLTSGHSYTFYVRCEDTSSNANTDDFVLAFSVARASATISNFAGAENPLSESGVWEAPGLWADLQKSDGAYATGLNAQARMLPTTAADQYAEITFDQDPGAASWVGVTTRGQGTANGGGYLAIAYAGEVRLYRTDDTGALNFTLLAAASPDLSVAPRRLRLESEGTTHTVYFNGVVLITATEPVYSGGQPGMAASVFGGPQVKILSFEGGNLSAGSSDTTPPGRFDGQPVGVLGSGTTQATVSLTTDEAATCRYSTQAGVAYNSMPTTFTTTGATTHTTTVNGLTSGHSYTFYVRCVDALNNANTDDFVLAFSVASVAATTSNFVGVESPLSESGVWDTPGMWADLQKNHGAYATGLNAQALMLPTITADQYAEITYDQDPGAASWVGVMTRVQGTANGSGYLVIAYAGEVRLYRADDTGALNFTLLTAASVDLSVAPRRLRLESEGNTHTVYFNGTQVISHNATGTLYTSGQPGIAASVFGGPQVKILSFEGGDLDD